MPAAKLDARQRDIEWALALGGRFERLHDPVVAAYAIATLGGLVCGKDPEAGAGLYREALSRMRLLTPDAFTAARHRLPVASFTALWKAVTPAALKCAPELAAPADTDGAKAKTEQERQQANDTLRKAYSLIDSNPDRAAQLAETAITSSDPTVLDIAALTFFLSRLRGRAADVADEVFPEALDFIASASAPSPGLLLELGKYLFTGPQYRESPDEEQAGEVRDIGSRSIANFAANRKTANSDDIHDYIASSLKVLTATNDPYYDPVAAYAIAYQMLPKLEDFAPEIEDKFREVLNQVTALTGGKAAQVQSAFSRATGPDQELGEGPRARTRMVRRVLAMAGMQKFAEARDLLKKVDDLSIRGQVGSLIDFAESAAAIEKGDIQWAFTLANTLRGGMKRAFMYAAITASAGSREVAFGHFQLGLKDSTLLPAEQRMMTLAALAGAMLRLDAENGFSAVSQFVEAGNHAYISPHQGIFDPAVVRKIYSGKTPTTTDSALILANRRHTVEVVDSGLGRNNFPLKVPGVPSLDLPVVLRNAAGADPERLEAIVLGLRDETLLADALNALAWLRLDRGGLTEAAKPGR